jgi:hypothetical protein
MISDAMVIYFLGQIVLLIINTIAYTKLPYLGFIGVLGSLLIAADTIIAFDSYYMIAIILVLTNIIIPVWGILRTVRI